MCGSSAEFREDRGKTMTVPEPQEWLKSATGGETDSPTGEVNIRVDEVTVICLTRLKLRN